MDRTLGHIVARERLHLQPPKCGRPGAAICCLGILIGFVVLEDSQAWAQQVAPLPPSSPLPQQVSATQDVPADDAMAGDLPADQEEGDDILDILDLDIEQLARADVVVPSMDVEVTSVTRTEGTVGRSPAAIFVITPEMIRRSGATCIPEVLRMVPGLEVARINSDVWAISSRGFNDRFANKLLVQIDGRSIYTPIFSGVFWEANHVMLQDVERIEVIRGPGATVWGANAVNGVINIVTKSAKDTQGLLFSGIAGTVTGNYSFLRMQLHTDVAGGEAAEGTSPHNRAYLRSSWDLACHLQFDMTLRYVDSLSSEGLAGSLAVPSYTAMDLRLGWRPNQCFEAAVVGQNLLDSHHLEFFGAGTPATEVDRGVYATVTWRR